MRSLLLPVALIAGLACGQASLAATTPAAPAKPAAAAKTTATPVKADPKATKMTACEKTWTDQKKHTGKHKAFVAACMAKG